MLLLERLGYRIFKIDLQSDPSKPVTWIIEYLEVLRLELGLHGFLHAKHMSAFGASFFRYL